MASLVLKMSVSLDGFVAPIDGSTDWAAAGRSDDGARWTVETLSDAGAHLIGATTYAGWAGYTCSLSAGHRSPCETQSDQMAAVARPQAKPAWRLNARRRHSTVHNVPTSPRSSFASNSTPRGEDGGHDWTRTSDFYGVNVAL